MKNILGFIKENKKTIGMLAGVMATLLVARKVNRKINAKIEKVEKEYDEMNEVIESTHEMNLPEYTEEDYNNDKRINTTKKVVKKIGLVIGRLCISSIPAVLLMIDNFCRMRLASIEDGTTDGELLGNIIGLLPASLVWYFSYKIISV